MGAAVRLMCRASASLMKLWYRNTRGRQLIVSILTGQAGECECRAVCWWERGRWSTPGR